ncbi:MAG: methyltransferase domain-containing protein [Ktedonobacteraceae bacterium]|nr:methyltransferase domain-containing protein [Ktedonobacteraceae bacterium]
MSDSNQPNTLQDAVTRAKLQQVQRNFGAVAADYVTSKVHASGQDLSWLVEAAALTGIERVLDIATGGGHAAFALAPYASEVVALDLTRPMLEVAQQEATARQLSNIRFLEGDAQAIPCADESFDVVVCRQAAHHFPNVQQCVNEWARVLKPGGKLLLIDSISPEEPDADAFLEQIEILRDPSHMRNQRISEWKDLLGKASFTINTVREWTILLDIPSWTQRMRTLPASVAMIEQSMHDASPTIRERLHIEEEPVLSFLLPAVLIVGTRASKGHPYTTAM